MPGLRYDMVWISLTYRFTTHHNSYELLRLPPVRVQQIVVALSLPKERISVVESSGNCNIVAAPMFIRISGQKATQQKDTKGKAFNKALIISNNIANQRKRQTFLSYPSTI